MGDVWVVNASPLILLGKIGRIDLLQRLSARLVVPEGVAVELRAGSASDAARGWVDGPGVQVLTAVERIDPLVASWDLGLGETHVLTLCRCMSGAEAIIDDRAARNCASALSIPVRGTVSLIVLAKEKGAIAEVRPVLQSLLDAGIRLDGRIFETALRLAGE